jgi:alpha-glucuronidase
VEEPVNKPDNKPVNKAVNVQRRNQGRPPGSRNQPRPAATRQSARQHATNLQDINNQFISVIQKGQEICIAFITNKEQADIKLSIKLREEGTIMTPRLPFKQSQTNEIEGLIIRGVFEFV